MKPATLSAAKLKLIDGLVKHYVENLPSFANLLNQLRGHVETSKRLTELAHSIKGRTKDPEHLKAKLIRKGLEVLGRGDRKSVV